MLAKHSQPCSGGGAGGGEGDSIADALYTYMARRRSQISRASTSANAGAPRENTAPAQMPPLQLLSPADVARLRRAQRWEALERARAPAEPPAPESAVESPIEPAPPATEGAERRRCGRRVRACLEGALRRAWAAWRRREGWTHLAEEPPPSPQEPPRPKIRPASQLEAEEARRVLRVGNPSACH